MLPKCLIGASALAILAIAPAPAFAVAPNCADQLAQIKSELAGQVDAKPAIRDKYQEAERLCAANKDMEAQQLAQEIRAEMAQKTSTGSSATSGSTSPGGATTGSSSAPSK